MEKANSVTIPLKRYEHLKVIESCFNEGSSIMYKNTGQDYTIIKVHPSNEQFLEISSQLQRLEDENIKQRNEIVDLKRELNKKHWWKIF